jgi:hypothetical protein
MEGREGRFEMGGGEKRRGENYGVCLVGGRNMMYFIYKIEIIIYYIKGVI